MLPHISDYDSRDAWRAQAACRNVDIELFFPAGETGEALEQAEQAKAVCATCPVQAACLEFALVNNQQYGVWGGTTEAERRTLRRRRQRKAS